MGYNRLPPPRVCRPSHFLFASFPVALPTVSANRADQVKTTPPPHKTPWQNKRQTRGLIAEAVKNLRDEKLNTLGKISDDLRGVSTLVQDLTTSLTTVEESMRPLRLHSENETRKLAAMLEGAVRTILAAEHGREAISPAPRFYRALLVELKTVAVILDRGYFGESSLSLLTSLLASDDIYEVGEELPPGRFWCVQYTRDRTRSVLEIYYISCRPRTIGHEKICFRSGAM
ncbi:hypothetical protein Q9L58_006565 [Maublancomyces gigas]|uniref:Uncharacterized protein n=1 Tax=Discina gigas TaxID=1032678 RepID=A0ABR3GET3_9PEZI